MTLPISVGYGIKPMLLLLLLSIDQSINQCNDLQYFPMMSSYYVSLLMVQGTEQVAVHT